MEKLVQGAESGCPTEKERQAVLNCARVLSRVLPYIFEDQDWRGFFWSTVPGAGRAGVSGRMCVCVCGGCHASVTVNIRCDELISVKEISFFKMTEAA